MAAGGDGAGGGSAASAMRQVADSYANVELIASPEDLLLRARPPGAVEAKAHTPAATAEELSATVHMVLAAAAEGGPSPRLMDDEDAEPRRGNELERVSVMEELAGEIAPQRDHASLLESARAGALVKKHGRFGEPHPKFISCTVDHFFQWSDERLDSPAQLQSSSKRVALRDIRAIVKGKRSAVFARERCASVPERLCFSIITRDRTVDIEAGSAEERAFLCAAIDAAVVEARIAGQAASEMDRQWVELRERELRNPRAWLIRQFLAQGQQFRKYGRRGKPGPRWVCAADGHLFWARGGAFRPRLKCLPLYEVERIRVGKHTDVFLRFPEAHDAACFSLILADRTFNLEAPSKVVRDEWVHCLRLAVRRSKDDRDIVRDPSARAAVQQRTLSRAAAVSLAFSASDRGLPRRRTRSPYDTNRILQSLANQRLPTPEDSDGETEGAASADIEGHALEAADGSGAPVGGLRFGSAAALALPGPMEDASQLSTPDLSDDEEKGGEEDEEERDGSVDARAVSDVARDKGRAPQASTDASLADAPLGSNALLESARPAPRPAAPPLEEDAL